VQPDTALRGAGGRLLPERLGHLQRGQVQASGARVLRRGLSRQVAAVPGGSGGPTAVGCQSARRCLAVGDSFNWCWCGTGTRSHYGETWVTNDGGATWSERALPTLGGYDVWYANAVSCWATACAMTGHRHDDQAPIRLLRYLPSTVRVRRALRRAVHVSQRVAAPVHLRALLPQCFQLRSRWLALVQASSSCHRDVGVRAVGDNVHRPSKHSLTPAGRGHAVPRPSSGSEARGQGWACSGWLALRRAVPAGAGRREPKPDFRLRAVWAIGGRLRRYPRLCPAP
jgi:hypothetical protein